MDIRGHMEALAAMQEFLASIARIKREARERAFIGPRQPPIVVSFNPNDPPPKHEIEALMGDINAKLAQKGLTIRTDF